MFIIGLMLGFVAIGIVSACCYLESESKFWTDDRAAQTIVLFGLGLTAVFAPDLPVRIGALIFFSVIAGIFLVAVAQALVRAFLDAEVFEELVKFMPTRQLRRGYVQYGPSTEPAGMSTEEPVRPFDNLPAGVRARLRAPGDLGKHADDEPLPPVRLIARA